MIGTTLLSQVPGATPVSVRSSATSIRRDHRQARNMISGPVRQLRHLWPQRRLYAELSSSACDGPCNACGAARSGRHRCGNHHHRLEFAGRSTETDRSSPKLPATLRHVSIRGIVVGAEHHLGFTAARERGIHAGEAGNVGIRRARGQFVTPKASDTFFRRRPSLCWPAATSTRIRCTASIATT